MYEESTIVRLELRLAVVKRKYQMLQTALETVVDAHELPERLPDNATDAQKANCVTRLNDAIKSARLIYQELQNTAQNLHL